MISRLTACAAGFAILATALIGFAANAQRVALAATNDAARSVRVVQLEPVVISAKRRAPPSPFPSQSQSQSQSQ